MRIPFAILWVMSLMMVGAMGAPVRAAEFRVLSDGSPSEVRKSFTAEERKGPWVRMVGNVAPGDVKRLASVLRDTVGASETKHFNLVLNSNGGNFSEALKIADRFTYGSFVLAGKACYSACGIIFMAGRKGDAMPDRQMHAKARLGFHAPFLPAIKGTFTRKTLTTAYAVGMKASVALFERQKTFSLSDQWINALLRKGPEAFAEVTHVYHAIEFDIAVFGMSVPRSRPEVLVANLCLNQRDDEAQIDEDTKFLVQLERSGRPNAKIRRWHRDEIKSTAELAKRDNGTYAINATVNELTGQQCSARITASGRNLVNIWRKNSLFIRGVGSGIYLLHSRWAKLSNPRSATGRKRSTQCGWYAISFCSSDFVSSEAAAERFGGEAISTNDPAFPNFRNGWYCAVKGPLSKRRAQRERRAQRRRGARKAYIKRSC